MRKNIFIISSLLFLASCSTKSDEFCDCLKATEKLDVETTKILENGTTEASKKELIRLRDIKMDACEKFETMGKAQMLELQEDCK